MHTMHRRSKNPQKESHKIVRPIKNQNVLGKIIKHSFSSKFYFKNQKQIYFQNLK